MIKSNSYYLEVLTSIKVFDSPRKEREAKRALSTLKNRSDKALERGAINEEDYNTIIEYLNKIRRWYGLKSYPMI